MVPRLDDVANFAGVSKRTVQEWIARGCPGRPKHYDLSEMVQWAREHVWVPRRTAAKTFEEDGDPLLSDGGTGSVWLEKYRHEKTLEVRAKRLRDMGELVATSEIQDGLNVLSNVIRQAGELLQRTHGEEAYEILEEAIIEFETQAEELFGDSDRAAKLIHGTEDEDALV
ncbi:hypothetical protein Pla110_44270 [Polystyrenella longa]|uniref:Uncharacterized protein n=1 Tax=Polystyrenella longa TaxID=2528007 RepID=A0A518CTV5_9PLAN|nr:hypothetical protein [Polystyrenella longa]QDU82666.1 hypothetical protein Pla110_44270 [Polystyrenella longa]